MRWIKDCIWIEVSFYITVAVADHRAHAMFKNRTDADKQLATALEQYRNLDLVMLAVPRGGVAVTNQLDAPLDLIIVRRSAFRINQNSLWVRSWTAPIQ